MTAAVILASMLIILSLLISVLPDMVYEIGTVAAVIAVAVVIVLILILILVRTRRAVE